MPLACVLTPSETQDHTTGFYRTIIFPGFRNTDAYARRYRFKLLDFRLNYTKVSRHMFPGKPEYVFFLSEISTLKEDCYSVISVPPAAFCSNISLRNAGMNIAKK